MSLKIERHFLYLLFEPYRILNTFVKIKIKK